MSKIVHHEIADNQLRINNKEYVGLDVAKIIVGVENESRQEILQNPDTGLNYSRNAVEGQEIYKLSSQKHSPWFILDLETGGRGWFPGCVIHGDILNETALKSGPGETYETIKTISNASVTVLEIDTLDQEPYDDGWYKIKYDIIGYVKKESVTNLRYEIEF